MNIIISYLKKYKIVSIIIVSIVFVTIYFVMTSQQEEKGSTVDAPTEFGEGVGYNSITPGKSTEAVVTEQLGEPLSINRMGSKKMLEYKSSSPSRMHQIILENSQVLFIKEIVSTNDNLEAQDLVQKYGNPTSKLYNIADPDSSFSLYVYGDKGLAYLGHEDGTLLEVWYFPPTTLGEFINQWGQDYSTEKPIPVSDLSY
ncbi:MAG: hypothetical protein ACC618_01220 [Patescibacteria group bacterium]